MNLRLPIPVPLPLLDAGSAPAVTPPLSRGGYRSPTPPHCLRGRPLAKNRRDVCSTASHCDLRPGGLRPRLSWPRSRLIQVGAPLEHWSALARVREVWGALHQNSSRLSVAKRECWPVAWPAVSRRRKRLPSGSLRSLPFLRRRDEQRKRHHWRLHFCFAYGERLSCCLSSFATQSKPGRAHQKRFRSDLNRLRLSLTGCVSTLHFPCGKSVSGGPGRNRTAVLNSLR